MELRIILFLKENKMRGFFRDIIFNEILKWDDVFVVIVVGVVKFNL